MSIIKKAREKAKKVRAEKVREQTNAVEQAKSLQDTLQMMEIALRGELADLDGRVTPHGRFKLKLVERDWRGVIAYLTVEGRHSAQKVAWFKACVESGTFDASDDCRNISYTSPTITVRIYPPGGGHHHNGQWDEEQKQYYHNGGWTESADRPEDMPKLFAKIAEWIAKWCE